MELKTGYYRNENGPVLINLEDHNPEIHGPLMTDDEVHEWEMAERGLDVTRASNGGDDPVVDDASKVEVEGGVYTPPSAPPPATPPTEPPAPVPNEPPAPGTPIGTVRGGSPPPPPAPPADGVTPNAGETTAAPASQIAPGGVTKGVVKEGRKFFIINTATNAKLSEHGYASAELALADMPNVGN